MASLKRHWFFARLLIGMFACVAAFSFGAWQEPRAFADEKAQPTPIESSSLRTIRSLVTLPPSFYLYFEKDQETLTPEHLSIIADIIEKASGFEGYLLIEAFSDLSGKSSRDKATADRRGKAVETVLRQSLSGPKTKFSVRKHGSRYASADTEDGKRWERLVSVSLIEQRQAEAVNTAIRAARAIMSGNEVTISSASTGFIAPKSLESVVFSGDRNDDEAPEVTIPAAVIQAPAAVETNFYQISLLYINTPTAPATYRKLAYRGPSATPDGPGEFDTVGGSASSVAGAGLEIRGPIFKTFGFAIGARGRRDVDFSSRSDFTGGTDDQVLTNKTTAQAVGAWLDFHFLRHRFASSLAATTGLGLDFDYSTVQMDQLYRDDRVEADKTEAVTQVKSQLGVASIRLATRLDYEWGRVSSGVALNLQLPVAEGARTTAAPGDAKAWTETLDHRSSVGSEVAVSMSFRL